MWSEVTKAARIGGAFHFMASHVRNHSTHGPTNTYTLDIPPAPRDSISEAAALLRPPLSITTVMKEAALFPRI